MQVSVLHDFNWFMSSSDEHSPTGSPGSIPAVEKRYVCKSVFEWPYAVTLDMSISSECFSKNRSPLSAVRAWWSQSAGWTELGSSWETERSVQCRYGWPTWRAACSPAPRNAWAINSSTSSSTRSGPFHTQTKQRVQRLQSKAEDLICRILCVCVCGLTSLLRKQ